MRLSDRVWFWGFLAVIGGLVLLDVGIANGKDSAWWASWGQWAGAFGSVAAAGTAVWIAVEGWRRSDAQQRGQVERELASKFGVWIEREDRLNPNVMVVNSGPLPMYEVQLMFDVPDPSGLHVSWEKGSPARTKSIIQIDTVGPRNELIVHAFATRYLRQTLMDYAVEHLGNDAWADPDYKEPSSAALRDIRNIVPFIWLEAHFSDSNGQRWTRTSEGKLKPYTGWG